MYEKNRRTQKTLFGESENQNDSAQLPTRYQQYDFAKRHLRGTSRPQVFPIGEANPKALNYVGAIMSEKNERWLDDGKAFSRNFPQGQRVYETDGIAATLASQAGGLGAKTGLYAIANTLDANYHKGNSASSDRHTPRTMVQEDMKIRRLTPTECERLQGFPDGWTIGVSDTQRYKTLGNAVTVNVVREIIKELLLNK